LLPWQSAGGDESVSNVFWPPIVPCRMLAVGGEDACHVARLYPADLRSDGIQCMLHVQVAAS